MAVGSAPASRASPWLVGLVLCSFSMLLLAGSVAGTSYLSLSDQPVLRDMLREGQGMCTCVRLHDYGWLSEIEVILAVYVCE